MNPNTKQAYNLFHDGILALAKAERQGMRIDVKYCEKMERKLDKKINKLHSKLEGTKFFKHWKHTTKSKPNIDSNPQLSHFLYSTKKIKPTKTTITGKGSTDEEALRQLRIPELDMILEIRKLKKVKTTYLQAFTREQVNGYLHPFFNLHNVKTYRGSSDSPNFQNIPKRDKEAQRICRKAILPRPGNQLMEIDFKALEVAIAACYHKDPTMIKYIKDPKADMHRDMAKQIFMLDKFDKTAEGHSVLRGAAKNGFVFPQFYGDYYGNNAYSMAANWGGLNSSGRWKKGQGIPVGEGYLSDLLIGKGIVNLDDFTEHIKKIERHFWNVRFPVYQDWKEKWWAEYQKKGYFDLLTGFRCKGVLEKNQVINTPVQGAAFHCLLWCLIELDKLIANENLNTRIIGQIHDAIVFDANPQERDWIIDKAVGIATKKLPETWDWIIVPLSVEIDLADVNKSWYDVKSFEKI